MVVGSNQRPFRSEPISIGRTKCGAAPGTTAADSQNHVRLPLGNETAEESRESRPHRCQILGETCSEGTPRFPATTWFNRPPRKIPGLKFSPPRFARDASGGVGDVVPHPEAFPNQSVRNPRRPSLSHPDLDPGHRGFTRNRRERTRVCSDATRALIPTRTHLPPATIRSGAEPMSGKVNLPLMCGQAPPCFDPLFCLR